MGGRRTRGIVETLTNTSPLVELVYDAGQAQLSLHVDPNSPKDSTHCPKSFTHSIHCLLAVQYVVWLPAPLME